MICNHDTPGSSRCIGATVWVQSSATLLSSPLSFWCGTFHYFFSLLLSCPSNIFKQVHLQQQLVPVTEETLFEENQYHREATMGQPKGFGSHPV